LNTMLVTGLAEGEFVTISVVALNTGPCGDSAPTEQTCTTRDCPTVDVSIVPVGPFCAGDDTDVQLIATADGAPGGTFTWEQDNGSTSSIFNASMVAPGTYPVIVIYSAMDCTFRDTFDIVINARPASDFDLPAGPICTGTEVLGAARYCHRRSTLP